MESLLKDRENWFVLGSTATTYEYAIHTFKLITIVEALLSVPFLDWYRRKEGVAIWLRVSRDNNTI